MARLGAVKTSELMHEAFESPQRGGLAGQVTPGLVVVIAHADGTQQAFPPPPPVPMIDVTPIDEPPRPYPYEP